MKRLLIIFFITSVMLSCEDVLDKQPLDEITEANFWKTSEDLRLYVNRFYPSIGDQTSFEDMENNSDNLQPLNPNRILDGTRSVPSSGGGWNWGIIREVNYFLENTEKVTTGTLTDINQYKGEGHFFRAYFYFQMVKQFGDVPWYDDVLNIDSEELYAPRNARDEVINNILDDLDFAIDHLQSSNQIGQTRVNKEAALLFKSRVCLYEGTWEKYHKGTVFGVENSNEQQYLQMAADAAEVLVNDANFQLFSTGDPENDYYNMFNQEDLIGVSEAIMVQVVDPGQQLGTWNWTYLNGTRGAQSGITKELVDAYLDINGLPISLSSVYEGDTTLEQVVHNRDPRLRNSVWNRGEVQIATDPPQRFQFPALHKGAMDLATTGYMVRKGSTPDPEQNTGTSSDQYGALDGYVFRYAEALLNYAEAKAELGTLTQDDLDKTVNLIRQRVGMQDLSLNVGFTDPNWNFPELTPIINEIRRERRIELALEGFRFDDIMRWAAADELIVGKRTKGARFIEGVSFPEIEDQISDISVDENRYIDRYIDRLGPDGWGFDESRDYLSPLPEEELEYNKDLTQNPGW